MLKDINDQEEEFKQKEAEGEEARADMMDKTRDYDLTARRSTRIKKKIDRYGQT